MTKNKKLNKYEEMILGVLIVYNGPMEIRKISQKTGVSWMTIRKWCRGLEKRGYVKHISEKENGLVRVALSNNALESLKDDYKRKTGLVKKTS